VRKRGVRILLLVIGLGFRVSFGACFSSIVINCSRDRAFIIKMKERAGSFARSRASLRYVCAMNVLLFI